MRRSAIKLGSACLFLVVLIVFVRLTNDDSWKSVWMLLFIFIGTPFLILSIFDLGKSLRAVPDPTWLTRALGIPFSVPQALFAVLTIAIGVSLIGWVIYNSFVRRVAEYSGGFLTFGMGPAMILGGVGWLRQIIRGARQQGSVQELE